MAFDVKACTKCGVVQSLGNYYKDAGCTSDGTIGECKTCVCKRTTARKVAHKEVLNEIKMESGCRDCGYNANPLALQFDHLGGKELAVSQMKSYSMERLMAEVAKCEVVCANCHHIRTHRRLNDA